MHHAMSQGLFLEVLPGRLYWAPLQESAPATFNGQLCQALDLCMPYEDTKVAAPVAYAVTHYTPTAFGRAFGPMGLDVVLLFCRGLAKHLQEMGAQSLALGTTPKDVEQRANAAVLLGAYLILVEEWAVVDVVRVLGKREADLTFACSWSRKDRPEPRRNMTVMDCWCGLELAGCYAWVDTSCLENDADTRLACRRWREWVATCDCSWLVPGFVLVGADPVTTAIDPNPMTFKTVFPSKVEPTVVAVEPTSVLPNAVHLDEGSENCALPTGMQSRRSNYSMMSRRSSKMGSRLSDRSVNTVCKDYAAAMDAVAFAGGADTPDFLSVLQIAGVSTIVRTNFADERGMPSTGGYDASGFEEGDIAHYDVQIVDTHGGLPSRGDVERALRVSPQRPIEGALFVHCKGGFGRSMTLACCVAVERLDVPGAALLGWARIARPGAINTPQQERLLQSLRGRMDVRRYAGLEPSTSKCCCKMQ